MATKTFKTRIKLKYDLQSAWNSNFSALTGELLLGKDAEQANKVFANVGVEGGSIKPLSILTNNVLIESVNEGVTSYQTLTAKLGEIDTALGAGGSVAEQIATAIDGLDATAFQLASIDNDSDTESKIYIKKIEEVDGIIKSVGTDTFSVNIDGKYNASTNKIATESTVSTVVGAAQTVLQGQIDTLEGTVGEHGGRLTVVEGVARTALQSISKGTDGTFVTTTVSGKDENMNQTVGVSVTTKDVSGATSENNGLATANDVRTYVDNVITSAVEFKGVVNSLPTNPSNGDMYKVSGEITVSSSESAGESFTTKVGDTIIYKVDGENGGWYLIPSGDQDSDTWRAIKVNNSEFLASGITTSALNIAQESNNPVEVSGNNGTITISHATTTPRTAAAVKVGNDGYGHVLVGDALTAGDIAYIGVQGGTVGSALDSFKQKDSEHDTKIAANTAAINTLNDADTVEGSVAKSIKDAISELEGNATIATVNDGVVKLKAGVTEANGVISNSTGTDITLAKVATTGAAADVSITDTNNNYTSTNVEGALNEILTWEFIFDCGNATNNNVTPVQG